MLYIDLIIIADYIISVNSDNKKVLNDYAIAIDKSIIIGLAPSSEIVKKYSAQTTKILKNHCLMPGFINAHTHSPMSLLRGFADDKPLDIWLNNYIWPIEAKLVDYDFVKDGSTLAIAEMIQSGTTFFNDMYFFPDATIAAVIKSGIKATIGLITLEYPSNWANNSQQYLQKAITVYNKYKNTSNISFAMAPHAPYTNSDKTIKNIIKLSKQYDIPVHTHIHETKGEIKNSIKEYGVRPLTRLKKLGLLKTRLMAVHMTQLTSKEINDCKNENISIIHCPQSNMKLASGFCKVGKLIGNGVNVAIGTDSASSNNDLDMLAELSSASLLAKVVADDTTVVSAYKAIQMATINSAKALGLEDKIGSIEIGKQADIIAIDLGGIVSQPCYDVVSQIVYSTTRDQISNVWVDGNALLDDKKLTTLNKQDIINNAKKWHNKIQMKYKL